jgi:oligopeptide/dipeptide ABC transporter ATP-binding protein
MIRAFRHAPSGMAGLIAILLLVAVSLIAPLIFGEAARTYDPADAYQNSSSAHLLGTDQLGRDILLRIVVATRLSIGLALVAAALAAVVGISLGAAAAIAPRRIRPIGLRVIDTMLAFPAILVAIFVGAIIGPGAAGAAIGVGIAISFYFARVASTLALSIGGREYVMAARVIGVKGPPLLLRYVLPNIAETLIIVTTAAVSNSIVFISSLSFLGLGVQAPDFDWGRMLTEGVHAFYVTPAAALAPAVAIAISAVSFGFAGEAMARAMNPLLWTRGADSSSSTPTFVQSDMATIKSIDPAIQGTANGSALEVRDLVVRFPSPTGDMDAVAGISFTLSKGEMLGIVGESGSGKTMTAMAISQLVPYPARVTGTVKLNGHFLQQLTGAQLSRILGTSLAVVFQDPTSSLNPALKIGIQLTEAAEVHRDLDHTEAVQLAISKLREVNMPAPESQLDRHPHQLSGGMRQRTMIAMGLMNELALLIADEPTTSLDVTIQAQIMDLLRKINAEHRTAIILISHNLALVSQNCSRVLIMYAGRVVEDLSVDELLQNPLHPYTKALLSVVPDIGRPRDQPLEYIPGQAPGLETPPPGCPYHPRCPLALDRCAKELPPLLLRTGGRRVACWVANEDRNDQA